MKILVFVCVLTMLTGCSSLDLEDSIGVGPEDNAILCVRAEASFLASIFGSKVSGERIEVPKDVELTVEEISSLIDDCR